MIWVYTISSDSVDILLGVFNDFLESLADVLDAGVDAFLLLHQAVVGCLREEHDFELHGVHDVFHLLLLFQEAVREPVWVGGVLAEADFQQVPHLLLVGFFQGLERVLSGLHGSLDNFSHSWIHLINIVLAIHCPDQLLPRSSSQSIPLVYQYRSKVSYQAFPSAVCTSFSFAPTVFFSKIRYSSPSFFGSSTLGSFSFSPFLGKWQCSGVSVSRAGLKGLKWERSALLLQVTVAPNFLSMKVSQLSFFLLASTVQITHCLNLNFWAQSEQLSLNSKYSSLAQKSLKSKRFTFLLFGGKWSWFSQSQSGTLGMNPVVFRYSQRRNLEKLQSSKENYKLADFSWLQGRRPIPKA